MVFNHKFNRFIDHYFSLFFFVFVPQLTIIISDKEINYHMPQYDLKNKIYA